MANDVKINETVTVGAETLQLAAWAAADGRKGMRAVRRAYETAPLLTIREDGSEVWFEKPVLVLECGKLVLKAGGVAKAQPINPTWVDAMRAAVTAVEKEQSKLEAERKRRNRGGSW